MTQDVNQNMKVGATMKVQGIPNNVKIYQGNDNSIAGREICKKMGVGIMCSPGGCTDPKHFAYFAIDNGAYSFREHPDDWDGDAYLEYLEKLLAKGTPDFIITPDKVACGLKSLLFSLVWNMMLRSKHPEIKQYLAVQDGMTPEDIEPHLDKFDGIFVGGSPGWKFDTAEMWAKFAHAHNLPAHIGRTGTKDKITRAMAFEFDSFDSSSWGRNGTYLKQLLEGLLQRPLMEAA